MEQGRYRENLLSNGEDPRTLKQTTRIVRNHCTCKAFRIKLYYGLASTDLQMLLINDCLTMLNALIGSIKALTRDSDLGQSILVFIIIWV